MDTIIYGRPGDSYWLIFVILDQLLVSIHDGCRILGIGLSSFKSLIARGELRTVTVGRRRLIPVDELRRYVDARIAAEEGAL